MTTPSSVALLDQPDGAGPARKAVWNRVRAELGRSIRTALAEQDTPAPRVRLIGDLGELGAALSHDLGFAVGVSDVGVSPPAHTGDDVVGLVLPAPAAPPVRIELFRAAMRRLRSTGRLVVVATVVASQQVEPRQRPPSMSQLFEELDLATGGAVELEDLRSVQWAREPFRRGVVVTLAALVPSRGW